MKYLSPFYVKPDASAITVSKQNVNIDWVYKWSEDITVSPYLTNWTVSSSDSWCYLKTTGLDRFMIAGDGNYSSSPRTATVTVKMEGLPDKTIQVTQAGS